MTTRRCAHFWSEHATDEKQLTYNMVQPEAKGEIHETLRSLAKAMLPDELVPIAMFAENERPNRDGSVRMDVDPARAKSPAPQSSAPARAKSAASARAKAPREDK